MNLLVTGGCGFIGSHFIEHVIVNTAYDVAVIDGLTYAGDTGRVVHTGNPRVRFFWHDLRSPIPESMRKRIGHVDWVVNFAAESHVDNSISNPADFVHNNVMEVIHAMQYALDVGAKKFLHVSTDEVFGPAAPGVRFSEWDVYKPSNPYSASKASQDHLAFAFWRTYNLPLIITNAMNNFGERQHPEKLIPKAIKRLLNNEVITLHADKNEDGIVTFGSRFWLHARNHADALLYLLEKVEPVRFGKSDVPDRFNVVGDVEKDVLEIVNEIAYILRIPPKIDVDYGANRPGHDIRYALDGTKLAAFGWKPPLTFEESFTKTVTWTANHKEWLF